MLVVNLKNLYFEYCRVPDATAHKMFVNQTQTMIHFHNACIYFRGSEMIKYDHGRYARVPGGGGVRS